jgi:predicted flap endonuclease-1-like 5' DNA nuclease
MSPMAYKITDIEGIGPAFGAKLEAAGVRNTDQLLEAASSAKGRKDLAAGTEISEALILKWVNHADLMRISGIGPQFAELLDAGVDTVKELRHRNAANLAAKMTEINERKNLTNGSVSESQAAGWIEQAKSLEPKVSH